MEAPSEHVAQAGGRDERELAALRAGDDAAFLALVSRHQSAMLRIAMTHVRSRAVAEEVVQEAWIGVLRGLHRFEGRSTLRCRIFSILVNCAKSRGVHELRTIPMSALSPDPDDDAPSVTPDRFRQEGDRWAGHWSDPPEPWPDERVASAELVALVREALETLPATQRARSRREQAAASTAQRRAAADRAMRGWRTTTQPMRAAIRSRTQSGR
jgi:RNA polymerase sigma-70 factor (ECF subfamily)